MVPGMRRRQNPERMAALLAERDRHGWNWPELSRRSGLSVRKLRWWHERFKRTPAPRKRAASFVAVEIRDPARVAPTALEITTSSGARVLVPPGFDPDHLRRLLQVLGAPC